MTPENFLAQFGHIADSPNGVQKLRELTLDLAVRGKLVSQDPNDEPASELLKRIAAEKARLVRAGVIRKAKPTAGIDEPDLPHHIPDSWVWARFGDIALHNAGKTLDRGRNSGQLRQYITTSNLYWGRFELGEVKQMPIRGDELDKCTARKGDLLICEGGEAGRAAVWDKDYEICFQNHVHRARFYYGVDSYYAYRVFEKLNATGEINEYRKGVGISNMSGKALASIVFPLPPLEEQKRIVAKVDQLMALCDRLEAQQKQRVEVRGKAAASALDALVNSESSDAFDTNWRRISANFDRLIDSTETLKALRSAILDLAVRGKLVPQNEKEKASIDHLIISQKELFQLPAGWHWVDFGSVAKLVTSGSRGWKQYYSSSGASFIRSQDIKFDRLQYDDRAYVTIPEDIEGSRTRVYSGDLLITITGANVGKSAFVKDNPGEAYVSQHVALIRLQEGIFGPYVHKWLTDDKGGRWHLLNSSYGAKPGLNLTNIKELPIPLPPVEEQKRIVAKVDQLMAVCDRLEAQLGTRGKLGEKLAAAFTHHLLAA